MAKQIREKTRKGVPASDVTRALAQDDRKSLVKIDATAATPSRAQDWPVNVSLTDGTANERIYGVLIEYQSNQEVVIGVRGTYRIAVDDSVTLSNGNIGDTIVTSTHDGTAGTHGTDGIGFIVDWDNTTGSKWVEVDLQ